MDTLENIVVKISGKGFTKFVTQINKVKNSLEAFGNPKAMKAFNRQQAISNVRNKQAMDGFKTRFGKNSILQKQLKSLSKDVMNSIKTDRPPLTADQSVQNILNSQKEIAEQSKNMKKGLEDTGMERLIKKSDSWNGVMGLSLQNLKGINQSGNKFKTMGGRVANTTRLMTHGLRGFRMEMLGVMFFGMMLQKSMFGLLRPAGEATGIFEFWSQVLIVLFLPIMLKLLPLIIKFGAWIMSWPDWIKLAVGGFVLFLGVLGLVLMIIGQFALGVGSVILMANLGKIGSFLTNVMGFKMPGGLISLGKFLKFAAGLGLIAIGITLAVKSFGKEGVQVGTDLAAAVALILGLKMVGVSVGMWTFIGVVAAIIALDIVFHVIKIPGIQWIQDLIAIALGGVAIYAGAAALGIAGVTAGWAFAIAAVVVLGLDFLFSPGKNNGGDTRSRWQQTLDWLANSVGIQRDFHRTVVEDTKKLGEKTVETMDGTGIKLNSGWKETGDVLVTTWKSAGEGLLISTETTADGIENRYELVGKNIKQIFKDVADTTGGIGGGGRNRAPYTGNSGFRGEVGTSVTDSHGETTHGTGFNDFIWRPGQAPISISPNDNLIGFKGSNPMGSSGGVNVNQTLNINVSNTDEIERQIKDNNSRLVDDIKRLTSTGS